MTNSKAEQAEKEVQQSGPLGKLRAYLRILGPGLITGASGDDPSGIGTYSQTGAQFGYTQLWTALFTFPLQAAVQEICARIALQTGRGLAANIRKYYPKPILYFYILILFIANTTSLGADLGAMAASAQLLFGLPVLLWLAVMTILTAVLEIFIPYKEYAKVLRILTLTLFAYVIGAFFTSQDWGQALRSTIIPTFRFDRRYLFNLVALLGTTITPYLFFWQANQEVEEEIEEGKTTETQRKGVSKTELKWMRTDVISGSFFSNIVFWFIIITTASALNQNGITNIDSAPKAAEALRPLAGDFAYILFSAGIIGTGFLAVPILAGSAAYAVSETFKFREGLSLQLREAPAFYGVIALATVIGGAMNLTGINPISALYYAAVLNGIVAPLLLFMIMLISNNRTIMQNKTNGKLSNILGWIATIAMGLAAVALLISFGVGK
ncbi:MAG TPA: Nramp family divalent metal transporter [Anaerolineales bacterium]|nr:Nramp family divalent metal transporter [Anaerolineales bacterium]